MLNISKTGFVRYKAVKVATLDYITQIAFFLHTASPHLIVAQGHNLCVLVCLSLAPLHAIDNIYDPRKVQCVLWSYSPRDFLVFFQ